MKISIICPTYNSEKFIEKTLLSVFAQTRMADELILVDDGSDDETIKILHKISIEYGNFLSIKIFTQSHLGPGAARNKGILQSTSDWVAFLDSDDIWYPEKLEIILDTVSENPDINFISHDEMSVRVNGSERLLAYSKRYKNNLAVKPQLYRSNFFSTSAVVCKKTLIINNGLFDESLMSAQDYELWLRIADDMKPIVLDNVLGKYIERQGNISSNNLYSRFINDLYISFKHRQNLSLAIVMIRFIRIMGSYIKQLLKRML